MLWCPFLRVSNSFHQFSFRGVLLRPDLRLVLPASHQRQAHENALNACTRCAQTELRPSVIHQVELDIPPSPQGLPPLVMLRKRHADPPTYNGLVRLRKRFSAVPHKVEQLVLRDRCARSEVIEEDAANAAGLLSVGDVEVFVAPGFEARVVRPVVCVTGALDGLVEVLAVAWVQVGWGQVCAAAEPPRCWDTRFGGVFDSITRSYFRPAFEDLEE